MKKIASGLQYHVYELGDDKVLKKETILRGNTETTAVVRKSLNMLFSLWKNKKQNSKRKC